MLTSFFVCTGAGAVVGFGYAWGHLSANTSTVIAKMRDLPIDHNDKAQRRAFAFEVGRIKGMRDSAAMVTAMLGALVGLAVWIIWEAAVWIFG